MVELLLLQMVFLGINYFAFFPLSFILSNFGAHNFKFVNSKH